jgi:hypothetical protein
MSIKLKALGLALFAALAVGAVSVVSATAETGGHFTSESDWTHITGTDVGGVAENYLIDTPDNSRVTCPAGQVKYTASISGTTVTQITATAEYPNGCEIRGTFNGPATVHMNGCDFTLTVESAEPEHTAAHLVCPTDKEVTVTADPATIGSCIIHIPPQTPTSGGVVYEAGEHNGAAGLTLNITAEGVTVNETPSGFLGCGTVSGHHNDSDLYGTATVSGKDTDGIPVDIKATGPDA